MRRFISTTLIAASLLAGTLSLTGCIVAPRDHGRVVRHDGPEHRHDHDHDGDHDHGHDHDHDGNHQY